MGTSEWRYEIRSSVIMQSRVLCISYSSSLLLLCGRETLHPSFISFRLWQQLAVTIEIVTWWRLEVIHHALHLPETAVGCHKLPKLVNWFRTIPGNWLNVLRFLCCGSKHHMSPFSKAVNSSVAIPWLMMPWLLNVVELALLLPFIHSQSIPFHRNRCTSQLSPAVITIVLRHMTVPWRWRNYNTIDERHSRPLDPSAWQSQSSILDSVLVAAVYLVDAHDLGFEPTLSPIGEIAGTSFPSSG